MIEYNVTVMIEYMLQWNVAQKKYMLLKLRMLHWTVIH